MYKNNWFEQYKNYSNKKVLLMLSGGKDSSACLHILSKAGVNVTAIHFKHKWGYDLSTGEAKSLCEKLAVPFIEIDFTDQFCDAVVGYKGGRPCLLCKPRMYELVIEELKKDNYDLICIGDNANDRTTIVRLQDYIAAKKDEDLYCSTYFGSERGVVLPAGVKVLRPLLDLNSLQVEEYLSNNGISIRKNHSTGDKYFEYSREGCPVQFHDPGHKISVDSMDKLKKYNYLITQFARKYNIRASVHLPSTFIITIPSGYELEAGAFLEENGLRVDWNINGGEKINIGSILIIIRSLDTAIFEENIQEGLFERMIERLELKIKKREFHEFDLELCYIYDLDLCRICFRYLKERNILSIDFISDITIDTDKVENLVLEIFRSRDYILIK